MEFLLYLNSTGKDIYSLLAQKVRVIENAPVCRQYDIYGWYQTNKRTMILCTSRIKAGPDPDYYMNETLYHESVHVAQSCKNNMGGSIPLGIDKNQMPLSPNRVVDLRVSTQITSGTNREVEHEAFWMENKPEKVKYVLQKYCF